MDPVIGLALGRTAVGGLALARPALLGSLIGVDVRDNPQLPYVTRLFGARELAFGIVTLLARGNARRSLVMAGIGIDAADAATSVLAIKDGTVSLRSAVMLLGPAVGAVVTGASSLRVN